MSARPQPLSVLRDVTSYIGGWLLIFKQAGILFAPPAQTNETLIWVAGLLIGVPGLAQLIAWKTGGGTPAGTAGPPALPASPPPPSSSGTPSPVTSEVE